jgi:hypothetical protein
MQSSPRLNWWHGIFFALGVTVAIGIHFFSPITAQSSLTSKLPMPVLNGPWGNVEYTTVELERPDESFVEPAPPPVQIKWVFGRLPFSEVENLVGSWDLTPDQKKAILDKSRWTSTTNGLAFLPTAEYVRDLSMPARKAIYERLGKIPDNAFISNPARIEKDKFEQWLSSCGLSKENQALVRNTSIEKNGEMVFHDSELIDWFGTTAERKGMAKALTRTSTLLMKIRITPETDLDRLLQYWGQGGKGKAMRPLLESLRKAQGDTSLSISFFFPTFARMRLYTYPDTVKDKLSWREDCFWTALNFFNETPDYNVFNVDQIYAKLKSDYTAVKTNWTFGDIILLVENDKEAIHMCVYVADDVVFTKNGANLLAPWVLMRLPEMIRHYPTEKQLSVITYRRKTA